MLQKVGAELKPALAFLRRGFGVAQRSAIQAFATASGFEIVGEITTAIESGVIPTLTLAALTDLLVRVDLNSARTIIVSTASLLSGTGFERIVCYERLRERGIDLIAADTPDAFAAESDEHPEVRKILAASAQFDAASASSASRLTVSARRASTGPARRRRYADIEPEATLMAKRIYQSSRVSGDRVTLREISAKLAEVGFVSANKKPFHPEAIRRMLKGHWPRNKTSQ
ncbi:Resolvase/invertase-type recombinase catalytic domain-containing protein [Hyphomicrobium sp. 1Nfss2.1]